MLRHPCGVLAAVFLTVLTWNAPCHGGGSLTREELLIPVPWSVLQGRGMLESLERRTVLELQRKSIQRLLDDVAAAEAGGIAATLLRSPLSWRSWIGHPLSSTRRPQKGGDRFQFQLGLYRIGKKEFQKAAEAFLELLRKFPDSRFRGQALYWLAESHYGSGNWAEAEKAFQILLREEPPPAGRASVLASLGWISQRRGRLEDALGYYRQVLDSFPGAQDTPSVVFQTGEVLYELHKPSAAAEQFMRASREMRSREERERALLWWAESLRAAGEYSRAMEQFTEFLMLHGDGPLVEPALYGTGLCFLGEEEYDRAGEVFLGLVENRQGTSLSDEALLLAGWSYLKGGRFDEAYLALDRLISRYPASPWADRGRLLRGIALYEQGGYGEALEVFAALSEGEGAAPETVFMEGMALSAQGRYEEAFDRFKRLVDGGGKEMVPTAQARAGWTAYRAGYHKEAELRFTSSLSLHQSKEAAAEAWFWLGEVFLADGRMEEAALHFARSLETLPNGKRSLDAGFSLAEIRFRQERWREAADRYLQVVESSRGDSYGGRAMVGLATSLVNDGRESEALDLFRGYLEKFPPDGGSDLARYCLGRIYLQLGEQEKAREEFDLLVREHPGSEFADDARYQMGREYYRKKSFSEAVEEFGEVVRLYPGGDTAPHAQLKKADALYRLGMYPESMKAYRELTQWYPQSEYADDAEYGISIATLAQGDFDGYAGLSLRFARTNPKSPLTPKLLTQLGRQLLLLHEYERAGEIFFRVLRDYPGEDSASFSPLPAAMADRTGGEHTGARSGRLEEAGKGGASGNETADRFHTACRYLDEGDCQGAIREYDQILQTDPSHPLAEYALFDSAGCQVALNRPERAREAYKRIAVEFGRSKLLPGALYRLGSLALEGGDYEEAAEVLAQVPSGDGSEVEALTAFKLGRALENLGREDEAYVEYRRVLVSSSEGGFVRMAALRGAEIALARGRKEEAAVLFREVLSRGSGDVLAELAAEGLKKTGGEGPGTGRRSSSP